MEDDPPFDTFSSTCDTKERKVVLVGNRNWITGAIQDKIFRSINFHVLQHAVESDITKTIVNWRLKVDLEDPLSAEYVNKMTMTAKYTASDSHGMHCGFEGRGGGPDYECYQL
jgi:hypothetical protein